MDDLNLGLALAGLLLLIGMQRMQVGHAASSWFAAGFAVSVLVPLTLGGGENQLILLTALGLGVALALILGLTARMADLAARLALLHGLTGAATALVASLALIEGLLEPGLPLGLACLAIMLGAFSAAGAAITHARLANRLPRVWRHISQTGAGILLLVATLGLGVIMALGLREGIGWLLLFLGLATASGVTFTLPLAEREAPLAASLFGSLSGLGLALLGTALDLPPLVATGILSAGLTLLLSLHLSHSVQLPLWRLLWGTAPAQGEDAIAHPVHRLHAETVAERMRTAQEVLLIPGFGCIAAGACSELIELGRRLEAHGARVLLLAHPLAGRLPGQLPLMLREVGAPAEWLIECWPQDEDAPALTLTVGAHDLINPKLERQGLPDLRRASSQGHEVILLMKSPVGFSGSINPLLTQPHVHLWQEDAREGLARLNALLRQG
ncbi:MAG: NAD(P)(+) transhydrogenase (Re/Si-specific) subunit beta [Halothiobacillaceae bacterium]